MGQAKSTLRYYRLDGHSYSAQPNEYRLVVNRRLNSLCRDVCAADCTIHGN